MGKQDNCRIAASVPLATERASLRARYQFYLPGHWAGDTEFAGRWGAEEAWFQTKQEAQGFHHPAALSIAAYAFLAGGAVSFPPPSDWPLRAADPGLPLSRPELGYTLRGAAGAH